MTTDKSSPWGGLAMLTRIVGGAARLAAGDRGDVVPCAITGTERLSAGQLPRTGRVRVSFGEPIELAPTEPTPEPA